MAETFNPVGISTGATCQVDARVLIADYGDGFAQRAGDGINTMPQIFDVAFNTLTADEMNYITGFFAAQRGYKAFLWTPPAATVAEKWICRRWKTTAVANGIFDVSSSFEQVFDN